MKAGISPAFVALLHAVISLPLLIAYTSYAGSWANDMQMLFSSKRILAFAILGSLAIPIGAFAILSGVAIKNATAVSAVEISYPLFVALFAWLFFREVQITPALVLGGALIFSGLGVILWKG